MVLSITTVGLVFGAIAPHGGLAVAEACTPDELELAQATRAGMEELGRAFSAARPEVVIVATPHNVHISGAFDVLVAGRVAGSLEGTPQPVALDVPGEPALAWLLLEILIASELPAVGVSFGSDDPSTAVAPMDRGVLIPPHGRLHLPTGLREAKATSPHGGEEIAHHSPHGGGR